MTALRARGCVCGTVWREVGIESEFHSMEITLGGGYLLLLARRALHRRLPRHRWAKQTMPNDGTMAVFVFVWTHSCCCIAASSIPPQHPHDPQPPGKTATVHHVLGRLRRERKDLPFTHVEVNGLTLSTPAQVTSVG